MTEASPDHSTPSRTRRLIDVETHGAVFTWVLERLAEAGLVAGKTVGIDATTLEANAAMRSIERRDTGESHEAFIRRLTEASGVETPTRAELARFDRSRKNKKTSNKEWKSPQDPYANRRRVRGRRGRRLQRRRGEVVERTFAHMYETGGMRRVWVRGHENVRKRVLIQAAACNIGLLLRRQTGVGTPRSLQGRALSAMLDRHVAVKTPAGRSLSRMMGLQPEAWAMARVAHAAVAQIYGVESWRGRPFLVVEFLPGGTLAARLGEGPIPAPQSVAMTIHLAEALAALHRAGYLHGDVKPTNIGFTADGLPKLLDFGLARPANNAAAAGGTLRYLSPEVLSGRPAEAADDVWSLCVVLYEMVSGEHPFAGGKVEDVGIVFGANASLPCAVRLGHPDADDGGRVRGDGADDCPVRTSGDGARIRRCARRGAGQEIDPNSGYPPAAFLLFGRPSCRSGFSGRSASRLRAGARPCTAFNQPGVRSVRLGGGLRDDGSRTGGSVARVRRGLLGSADVRREHSCWHGTWSLRAVGCGC